MLPTSSGMVARDLFVTSSGRRVRPDRLPRDEPCVETPEVRPEAPARPGPTVTARAPQDPAQHRGDVLVSPSRRPGWPSPAACSAAPASVNAAAEDLGATVAGLDRRRRDEPPTREPAVSRAYDRRAGADPAKAAALSVDDGPAVTRSVDLADGDPRDIARALMPQFGFGSDQFGCLDSLWTRESSWNPTPHNPSSGAHGIPQALPGSKMASAGADWATNPVTQISWGLGYIQDRYGSPCGAWGHSESYGWY